MHQYPDAPAVVRALTPDEPVILNRPHAAARAAEFFARKFPGKSLYAVKANPSPDLVQILWDNGITHYDVASIAEVRMVRDVLPGATLCFMHPVKTASAIREAYFEHGVRTFSLDTHEELEKIIAATADDEGNHAADLRLCVRLRVSSDYSELSPASKFGIDLADAGIDRIGRGARQPMARSFCRNPSDQPMPIQIQNGRLRQRRRQRPYQR